MKNSKERVGSEIVERLRRFNEKLNTADSASQLPELLTVRKVKLNLTPRSFTADEVKATRGRMQVSQAIFAEFIGVSTSTLQDWEQGITEPSGPARRIMAEMNRDPEIWVRRFRESSDVTSCAAGE